MINKFPHIRPGDVLPAKSIRVVIRGNLYDLETIFTPEKGKYLTFIYLGEVNRADNISQFFHDTIGLLGYKRMTEQEAEEFALDYEKRKNNSKEKIRE